MALSRGSRVFILRKMLEIILTVLIVTMISFVLMKLSPVDAAEAYLRRNQTPITAETLQKTRDEMGLSLPLPVQYMNWLKAAIKGDFGRSFTNNKPVLQMTLTAFSLTARIILLAGLIEGVFIVLLGALCYTLRGRFSGYLLSALCFAAISIPPFSARSFACSI